MKQSTLDHCKTRSSMLRVVNGDSLGNPQSLSLAETFPGSFKNFSDSKLIFVVSSVISPSCAGLSCHSKTSFSPPQIRRVSFANPIFQEGLADDIDRRSPVIRSHSSPSSRSLKILSNMQVRVNPVTMFCVPSNCVLIINSMALVHVCSHLHTVVRAEDLKCKKQNCFSLIHSVTLNSSGL